MHLDNNRPCSVVVHIQVEILDTTYVFMTIGTILKIQNIIHKHRNVHESAELYPTSRFVFDLVIPLRLSMLLHTHLLACMLPRLLQRCWFAYLLLPER